MYVYPFVCFDCEWKVLNGFEWFFFRKRMWIMLIVYYVTLFHCLYVTIFVGKLTVLRIVFKSWKVLTVEEPSLWFHFYVIDIKWWMSWRRVGIGLERRLTPHFYTAPGHLFTVWKRLRPQPHIREVLLYSATTTNKVQSSLLDDHPQPIWSWMSKEKRKQPYLFLIPTPLKKWRIL